MVLISKQKIKSQGVQAELSVNDATNLRGIHDVFDLVLDIGCFHSIPKEGQIKYLAQLNRILAPKGFWLMYGFLNPGTLPSTPGLTEANISLISAQLTLLSRRDGFDKRERPSTWFLFQNKKNNISV